jgi:hypothetical protein
MSIKIIKIIYWNKMDYIQDFLSGNNFWLNLLFLLLAVTGILATIISNKRKKCVYNIATFNLIGNNLKSINDLEIKYKHQLIKNLSVSYVSIWNSGNDVINKDDFANLKPLTISTTDENKIYYYNIGYIKNPINNFLFTHDETKILIDFDYFVKGEGFVIQIYHSGLSNANLIVNGIVKGGDVIKQGGYEKGKTTINLFLSIVNYLERFVKYISPNIKLLREILTFIFVIPILIIVIPTMAVALPLEAIISYFNQIPKEYSFENIYKTINND